MLLLLEKTHSVRSSWQSSIPRCHQLVLPSNAIYSLFGATEGLYCQHSAFKGLIITVKGLIIAIRGLNNAIKGFISVIKGFNSAIKELMVAIKGLIIVIKWLIILP
ncbi:unnamed protein product [Psylliodes chrysocephalus]|uniref:Uncharacterized protein n=1 Tax=Psylliodes chrysocephalus TaxID=3402493 RepID=A0A9P0G7G6_9CUCU|nr:unnamed protein product [Psylliodes chrysocephala]